MILQPPNNSPENVCEEGLAVGRVERRQACQHFIEQGPKTPPVRCFSVPDLTQDLRGYVLRGPAHGLQKKQQQQKERTHSAT